MRSWLGSLRSSTSSCCSPTRRTSSWSRELRASSSRHSSRTRPATSRCSSTGMRRRKARCSSPSVAPSTTGRRSSSARGSHTPTKSPLRLAGAAAVPEHGKRDASRLLSHGALAVQRVLGISAEPLLTPPGEEGMLEASRDAGLLVVGSVDEMAPRGPRRGPPETRERGLAAHAARATRPAARRPRAAREPDALHLVDSSLNGLRCRQVRRADRGGTPPTPSRVSVRLASAQARRVQDSGSMSQTAPSSVAASHRADGVRRGRDRASVLRLPAVSLGPICAAGGNVPEGCHVLEAGDREDAAVGAELERVRAGASLVELVEERPGVGNRRRGRPCPSRPRARVRPSGLSATLQSCVIGQASTVAVEVPVAASQTSAPPANPRADAIIRSIGAEAGVDSSCPSSDSPRRAPVAASSSLTPALLAVASVLPSGLNRVTRAPAVPPLSVSQPWIVTRTFQRVTTPPNVAAQASPVR